MRRRYLRNRARGNIVYPGLIAAWSAKGKSNDDKDRAILKDLTGNGHDISLNGFAFSKGSGYNNPNYPDALVFDGVDDYGVSDNMYNIKDFTLISKREIFENSKGALAAKNNNINAVQGEFWFEGKAYTNQLSSYGSGNNPEIIKNLITFFTPISYNGIKINKGDSDYYDTKYFYLGKAGANNNKPFQGAFYSAYLFDRSLDEQEIKSFIRKYIDPEYLLPSEQYLVLNQGKLNINKLK